MSNSFLKKPGEKLKAVINRRNPVEIFITFMAISLIVYLFSSLIYLLFGANLFVNIFFHNAEDLFMDFFNSLRDVAQGLGVYTERHVIYPPLANLIFLAFLPFIPTEYLNTSYDERLTWVNYNSPYFAIIIFIALFSVIYCLFCGKHVKFSGKFAFLLSVFLIINEPILFAIERGNILIFAIIAVNFFIIYSDSENKFLRELSIIALAFAIGLKLYPVLFCLFFIVRKKYYELLRCLIYSLIFLIVPCFFFGGFSVIIEIIKNVFIFMGQRSSGGEGDFGLFLGYAIKISTALICAAAFIYCLVFIFKKRDCEKWKFFTLIICVIEFTLPLHSIYVWGFTVAPLLLFMKEKTLETKQDVCYFIFLFIPFLILPSFIIPVPTLINEILLITSQIGFIVLTANELKKAK